MQRNQTVGGSRLRVSVRLQPLRVGVLLRAQSLGVPAAGASALLGWEGIKRMRALSGGGGGSQGGCALESS